MDLHLCLYIESGNSSSGGLFDLRVLAIIHYWALAVDTDCHPAETTLFDRGCIDRLFRIHHSPCVYPQIPRDFMGYNPRAWFFYGTNLAFWIYPGRTVDSLDRSIQWNYSPG